MKLLVWACSLCLIGNGVSGLFFDGLSEYFGGGTEETTMKPVNSTDATTKDFIDEMENAANNLDGIWKKFRKELLNLMSEDDDEQKPTPTVPSTGNFVVLQPNSVNKITTATTTPKSTTNINIISTTMVELPSSTPLP